MWNTKTQKFTEILSKFTEKNFLPPSINPIYCIKTGFKSIFKLNIFCLQEKYKREHFLLVFDKIVICYDKQIRI